MSAPGNTLLTTGIGLFVVAILCYAAGRLHQWYRTDSERELAYRDGYDTATKSLFALATRYASKKAVAAPARGAASVLSTHLRQEPITAPPFPMDSTSNARHRADPSGQWQTLSY